MKPAVALLALSALLIGTAPRAPAEDDVETAPGGAKDAVSGHAPPSGGSPNGPAANSAPGDDSTLSPPDADPNAQDPYETAPSADEGSAADESSVLAAPEGRGARAHDDPFADPDGTEAYDIDGD